MDALANTQEACTEVIMNIVEHPTNHEMEDCTTINTQTKEAVKQVKKEHDDFKANLREHTMSS